jgi:(5-formylfuran-3-yl)methyl phosphate synthase
MRLLVSAASAADAAAVLAGGAAFVDAKNPEAGPLGPVSLDVFQTIVAAVNGRRPVTAALGDAGSPTSVETDARMFASLGAAFVKVGVAGVVDLAMAHDVAMSAVRGARRGAATCGVILVAYLDRPRECVSPATLLDVASSAGAAGVLLDTADKSGPRLAELASPAWLTAWVERAHHRSLMVALAGRLCAGDLPLARLCGADVAGVRGAACDGGRNGRVSAAKVGELRAACAAASSATVGW